MRSYLRLGLPPLSRAVHTTAPSFSRTLSFPLLLLFELCLYLPNRLLLSSLAALLLLSLSLSLSLLLRALHIPPSIYAEICTSTSTPSFAIDVLLPAIELESTHSTPYRHRKTILPYHTYNLYKSPPTKQASRRSQQPNTYNYNQQHTPNHKHIHNHNGPPRLPPSQARNLPPRATLHPPRQAQHMGLGSTLRRRRIRLRQRVDRLVAHIQHQQRQQ